MLKSLLALILDHIVVSLLVVCGVIAVGFVVVLFCESVPPVRVRVHRWLEKSRPEPGNAARRGKYGVRRHGSQRDD